MQRSPLPIRKEDDKLAPDPNVLGNLQWFIPRGSKLHHSLGTLHKGERMVFCVAHVEQADNHGNRHQQAKNEIRQVSQNRLAITRRCLEPIVR